MTLNDLIEAVGPNFMDCIISIYIPVIRDGDQGDYPLIQVSIDQHGNENPKIILEADTA